MRLQKKKEMWFPVPGDPDGARVLIGHLEPGDLQDIADAAYKLIPEFTGDVKNRQDGELKVRADYNQKAEREIILQRAVLGWEKFTAEDGSELKCTPDNIIKAARKIEIESGGKTMPFAEFIGECRVAFAAQLAQEKQALEKNL